MNLVKFTDKILRNVAADIDFSDPPFDPVVTSIKMLELMYINKGVGLAGPQIGLADQIFVMGNDSNQWVVINPKITRYSEQTDASVEGCLSFPLLYLEVERSESIDVQYWDANGVQHDETFSGFWARVFQHEYDHLQGVCFDKKVKPMSLMMAKKRRDKMRRKFK